MQSPEFKAHDSRLGKELNPEIPRFRIPTPRAQDSRFKSGKNFLDPTPWEKQGPENPKAR